MAKILSVQAAQIFNSRGIPAVETTVVLEGGISATSSVPEGTSIENNGVSQLHDQDLAKYEGLGVTHAVSNVNNIIAKSIVGMDSFDQAVIDKTLISMDATADKSNLGANAMLSVSQAVLVVSAKSLNISCASYIEQFSGNTSVVKMPLPIFNILEGGRHAGNVLNFQEFLVIPASSKSYPEALDIGIAIYDAARAEMKDRGMNPLSADEAGLAPEFPGNKAAFSFLKNAIDRSGRTPSLDVFMGVDMASDTFYGENQYKLIDKPAPYTSNELLSFYQSIISEYALVYVEDPFASVDIESWKKINKDLKGKTLVVGDDLTTTNPFKVEKAIHDDLIGGIVVKPSQIGTITETIAVVQIARFKGLKIIVSGRSGETEDPFIADFAVGVAADYVKFGAPARERMVKYNRLLELERELKV